MRTLPALAIATTLITAPLATHAETFNIYGWMNQSLEFVDLDDSSPNNFSPNKSRDYSRIQNNAGYIGLTASMDTGLPGLSVKWECRQYTFFNQFGGGSGICNSNSKAALASERLGAVMFSTWFLPNYEAIAANIDPFYGGGADGHMSIMGSVGAHTVFYNAGIFRASSSTSGPASNGYDTNPFETRGGLPYDIAGLDTGFNRRQENLLQYWSPNINGFTFRYAQTVGVRDDTVINPENYLRFVEETRARTADDGPGTGPVRSRDIGTFRNAVTQGASYEATTVDLTTNPNSHIDPVIRSMSLAYDRGPIWLGLSYQDHEDWTAASVTDLASTLNSAEVTGFGQTLALNDAQGGDLVSGVGKSAVMRSSDAEGYRLAGRYTHNMRGGRYIQLGFMYEDLEYNFNGLRGSVAPERSGAALAVTGWGAEAAMAAFGYQPPNFASYWNVNGSGARLPTGQLIPTFDEGDRDLSDATSLSFDRSAWMISGKVKMGGPWDVRFSYLESDDFDISAGGCASADNCSGTWENSSADAFNIGVFYTTPGGTELRATYSEVSNDVNASYGQGIIGTCLARPGSECDMFALGVVHIFD